MYTITRPAKYTLVFTYSIYYFLQLWVCVLKKSGHLFTISIHERSLDKTKLHNKAAILMQIQYGQYIQLSGLHYETMIFIFFSLLKIQMPCVNTHNLNICTFQCLTN